ncbi:hypothetical protein C2L80_04180 [Rubneribacter badeniensis]|uniref:HTH luxR-type domain-containing protein n=1 Tax=Rubneribacter badeniensis TaxID=2070688 RepID=A0A2K2U6R4_9ACTN|nr:helix-turn-helix transcriptional regulator [Rubneribacter badeniensis]PNV65870.1 hypothetical protein C2L80_04180 [Rubneribacter badeniensis]
MGEGKRVGNGLAGWSGWCLGLCLVVSFSNVVSLQLVGAPSDAASLALAGVPSLARIGAYGALAVLAKRVGSVLGRRRLLLLAGVAMSVGAAGAAMMPPWAATLCAVVLNVGFAVLYLGWMELYAQFDTSHVLVFFTLAHFFSALLTFLVCLIEPFPVVVLATILMPAASLLALCRADRRTKEVAFRQGERQRAGWTISVRPLVLLAAFGFSNAVIRGFLGAQDRVTVLFGVCVAAACVLVAALARKGMIEIKALYQMAVPVLVAGALLVLMGYGWSGVAAALCSNAAFTLFSVFVTVVFCGISYRYGVNAVWMFGITQASLSLGSFAGKAVSALGAPLFADPEVLVATIAVLVVAFVALSMVLVSDRDFTTTWGVASRNEGSGALTVLDEEERTARACARVAQRYGLTRREEEVLVLMMRGYTLARIGEELYVADSTMKTHSRHIYRKVGVGNRNELQEFVAARRG